MAQQNLRFLSMDQIESVRLLPSRQSLTELNLPRTDPPVSQERVRCSQFIPNSRADIDKCMTAISLFQRS